MKRILQSLIALTNLRRHAASTCAAAPLALTALLAWAGTLAAGDVFVAPRWAKTAPVIDGIVSPGEWNTATSTIQPHGRMMTMNDAHHLYVLLDFTADTAADPAVGTTGDWFDLIFDVDLNKGVTPNVDQIWGACDPLPFAQGFYLTEASTTPCVVPAPVNQARRGFGGSFNLAANHRFYEVRLALAELGIDAATWTGLEIPGPRLRMKTGLRSATPALWDFLPPSAQSLMSVMYQLGLAIKPSLPPGSAGPLFSSVGLCPVKYIDGGGYANIIHLPTLYDATNAPFGGDLNIFGNWANLYNNYGARKYRFLYSKDNGPFIRLRQNWANVRWTTTGWQDVPIGPDADDIYTLPTPGQIWSAPDLLMHWPTAPYGDGIYRLRLQMLTAGGVPLANPPNSDLTLFVVNTPPTARINYALYSGLSICECGIITQGTDAGTGFQFDIEAKDANGALDSYQLYGVFASSQSTGNLFADTYLNGHVNQDGPKRWNGVGGSPVLLVPTPPWRANRSCAYTFFLRAFSRVQNGYGQVFPGGVADHRSLTILLGTGVGSNVCP